MKKKSFKNLLFKKLTISKLQFSKIKGGNNFNNIGATNTRTANTDFC